MAEALFRFHGFNPVGYVRNHCRDFLLADYAIDECFVARVAACDDMAADLKNISAGNGSFIHACRFR
jgi:hypothetical protein